MANENVLAQKQVVIDEISAKLENAKTSSVVVAEYRGLTVAEVTELRRALREEGVELKVYKNRLVQRATEATGLTELDEYLKGPNAFAFAGDDAVAPARVLAKFAKKHKALVVKSGIVEGKLLNTDEIQALATLPDRKGMYSMLLCCMKEPVAKVARIMQAVADKKGEGAAPAEEAPAEEAAAAA